MYPYVLKYERYPIGHPIRVTNDFCPLFKIDCRMQPCPLLGTAMCQGWHWRIPYFGLMKVKILPPCKLLFPVLPVKINGKLMFPLCHTCAENEDKGHCTYSSLSCALIHTCAQWNSPLPSTWGMISWRYTKCYIGPPMKKSTILQAVESYLLNTLICFSVSKLRPADILIVCTVFNRGNSTLRNMHPMRELYRTLNS